MECHACGAEISEKAADCPRCGASIREVSGSEDAEGAGEPGGSGTSTDPLDAETEVGSVDDRSSGPTVPGSDSPTTGSNESDSPATEYSDPGPTGDTDEPPTGTDGTGDNAGRESDTGPENEGTGWEAAGPPPEEQETVVSGGEPSVDAEQGGGQDPTTSDSQDPTTSDSQEPTVPGNQEPATVEASELEGQETGSGGRSEFGGDAGEGGQSPEAAEPAGGDESSEGLDPVAQIKGLPFLTAPLAGVVTAAVVTVLSVVVGVLVPTGGSDPVTTGAVVLMDLHFATSSHVTTIMLTQFDTARPPNSVLGLLYLLPPLFLYTAAKFTAAYNTDESTLTPVAGVGGTLVAVGYFPAILVGLLLAPGGPFSPVSVLPAVLLAGIAYPVFFGFVGGLAGGAFSGSERRISTLYGVVAFFVVAIGAFVFTIPSIQASGVGLLPQIHASLFSVVAANGFSLGGNGTGFLVLLVYPLVAFVVFLGGLLRAWNADDVAGPLRGLGKGLSLSPTYFTLLGLLGAVLALLADPWIGGELGFSFAETSLVQDPIQIEFYGIGRYVTVVFVGTLVYAVFLGGIGGTVAGTARYLLSDEN